MTCWQPPSGHGTGDGGVAENKVAIHLKCGQTTVVEHSGRRQKGPLLKVERGENFWSPINSDCGSTKWGNIWDAMLSWYLSLQTWFPNDQ